jgi:hypothetical protein
MSPSNQLLFGIKALNPKTRAREKIEGRRKEEEEQAPNPKLREKRKKEEEKAPNSKS